MSLDYTKADRVNKYNLDDCVYLFTSAVPGDRFKHYYKFMDFYAPLVGWWNIGFERGPFIQAAILYIWRELTMEEVAAADALGPVIYRGQTFPVEWTKGSWPFLPDNEKNRGDVWYRTLSIRMQGIFRVDMITMANFFTILDNFGQSLYLTRPDTWAIKNMEKYLKNYEEYLKKQQTRQSILNVIQGIVTIIGLLNIPMPSDILTDIQDDIKDTLLDFASVENLINISQQVIVDTVSAQLSQYRSDIIKDINDLDSRSALDLSSLTERISADTASIVKDLTGMLDGTLEHISKILQDRISATDKSLEDPSSKEYAALVELNRETGAGFVEALKDFMFTTKGTA